ncbi:hypothetical protein JCM18237_10740 [Halorubrum luteum]
MSSDTDADEGYVHTPSGDDPGGNASAPGSDPTTVEPDGFGRKGWILVAALVLSMLVIPGIIYAYPYAAGSFGLTFFGTYLLLPLIPAVLLGVLAVWSLSAAGPE